MLSVIVPTFNRSPLLRDVIVDLGRQTLPRGLFEVVVVDDGSTDDTADVIGSFGPAPGLRYVRQENAGLNAARNAGVDAASGDRLAFLDDDVKVPPGWAAAIVSAFESTGAEAVAGRVLLALDSPAPRWLTPGLRRYLSELDLGAIAHVLTDGTMPVGANCAITRNSLGALGGFRPGLDRTGSSLLSGGDTELFERLAAGGGAIVYWPDAVVEHRVPSSRLDLTWFCRRAFAGGVSDILRARPPRTPRTAIREAARAVRAGPILARSLVAGQGSASARVWMAYCRGRRRGLRELAT